MVLISVYGNSHVNTVSSHTPKTCRLNGDKSKFPTGVSVNVCLSLCIRPKPHRLAICPGCLSPNNSRSSNHATVKNISGQDNVWMKKCFGKKLWCF